jgi:hypothetical protein
MEKALFSHENNEADRGRRKKTAAAETKEGRQHDETGLVVAYTSEERLNVKN